MSKNDIDFDKHYNWTSHKASAYKPVVLTPEAELTIVSTLLRADRKFLHLCRKCTDRWAIAVRLGSDTIHMSVFDMSELKSGHRRPMARLMEYDRHVLLAVDRSSLFTELTAAEREAVLTIRPILYADRHLTAHELKMTENLRDMTFPWINPVKANTPQETQPFPKTVGRGQYEVEETDRQDFPLDDVTHPEEH